MTKNIIVTFLACFILASLPLSAQEKDKKSETYKKATKYFFQKKFEMAELLFREELKTNPENQLAYSYLGDIMLEKQQYDAAIELYKKSNDLRPNGEDKYRLGQAYYYKNLGNVAISHYLDAVRTDPKLKYSYYQIGLTYLMLLRDKENTISNWETYLRLAPEDPQYEKIRRAIEILRDPNFVLPPVGSDIPIEEALHLGGVVLQKTERTDTSKSAGHEDKKTIHKTEDIYRDDDMK